MNPITLFKTRSKQPIVLKTGQLDIYNTIVKKTHNRVSALCHTRYGKSLSVALGVIVRATTFPEKWVIIAPTTEKTDIIMSEIRNHLFDHRFFYTQLPERTFQYLKEKKTQSHLTFKSGGEIFCLTANANNQRAIGRTLLGEGAGNIIEDEAPLINDKIQSFIMRMLADSSDNFLFKIGNALENNHFKRSISDKKYKSIIVDCYKGIEESKKLPYDEAKLTPEFLEEIKEEPFFEQLWECKFPETVLTDEKGWTSIISESELKECFNRPKDTSGEPKLGVDVGRGGDFTVFVIRWDKYAKVLERNKDRDLMGQVSRIEKYIKDLNIKANNVFIDDIGIGGGISDRCREKDLQITPVVAGSKAQDDAKFKNVKAENYWNASLWLKHNALEEDKGFYQLVEIRHKEDSEKKLKIQPKDEYRNKFNSSPDTAEALMLTFSQPTPEPDLYII